MNCIYTFVEKLFGSSETSQEKEIIKKYINKMKGI